MRLDFSEEDFRRAVAAMDDDAASLWPDDPPLRRAVRLMLIHCDETLHTTGTPAAAFVMTLADDGQVVIEAAPPVDEGDAAARRAWAEREEEEAARIKDLLAAGRREGHTFEWRAGWQA